METKFWTPLSNPPPLPNNNSYYHPITLIGEICVVSVNALSDGYVSCLFLFALIECWCEVKGGKKAVSSASQLLHQHIALIMKSARLPHRYLWGGIFYLLGLVIIIIIIDNVLFCSVLGPWNLASFPLLHLFWLHNWEGKGKKQFLSL